MLSAKQIQIALYKEYRTRGWLYFSSNTKSLRELETFLDYEADFIGITRSKLITEFEIKRSRADYFNEFINKKEKHRLLEKGKLVNYFYFVCEENLIKESEVPDYCGLIYVKPIKVNREKYDFNLYAVNIIKTAPRLHTRKCSEYQLIQYLRSVMFKFYERLIAEDNESNTVT